MLKNYFKTALRSLWRNKVLSGINILGLAVGIAACLLILVFVGDELSYDRFQEKADRLVRVTMEYRVGGEVSKAAVTGTKVAPAFSRSFPEVESAVRLSKKATVVRYQDKFFAEEKFLYADSTFFRLFSFKLLHGDPATALAGPNKVVLTPAMARKYFGTENPVGKTLRIDNTKDYLVTGITREVAVNSQIKYDFLASFASLPASKAEEWWSANYYTYLLLRSPAAIATLEAKIPGYMRAQAQETGMTGADYLMYHLEPMKKVHLYSELSGLEPKGDITYIYIFGVIALLILLIAGINYVNLTTAHATERAKEVSIRKVIGALQGQLFRQFIGESFILTSIALLFSLLLVKLLLPVFNSLAGKELTAGILKSPFTLMALVVIVFLVSLLAGSFPAAALARFKPVTVLKGSFKNSNTGIRIRQGLIVFQFVISTFLIVSTLIVQQQLRYIQHKKIGYNNQQVLVLPADPTISSKLDLFKSEFKSNPEVKHLTLAYESPSYIEGGYSYKKPGESQGKTITALPVEKEFLATLDIPVLAGRSFNKTDEQLLQAEKEAKEHSFILNESAVHNLGWTVDKAVGKRLELSGRKGIVRGVVKDFHYAPLHQTIDPLVIFLDELYGGKMLVKIDSKDIAGTLRFVEAKWKVLAPHRPFEYNFLDEEYDQLYGAEQRTGKIFAAFSFLAILLACLGLFGLAAFTTVQRTKEIGIRKVLGATILHIILLLCKDFLFLVLLATVIASPLAWWAMHGWLRDFAYRIDISIWLFVLTGLAALLIAFVTISLQAIKAAVANPVKALRSE